MRVDMTEFKAKVDYYLELVENEKKEIVITRNGEAIAIAKPIYNDE